MMDEVGNACPVHGRHGGGKIDTVNRGGGYNALLLGQEHDGYNTTTTLLASMARELL